MSPISFWKFYDPDRHRLSCDFTSSQTKILRQIYHNDHHLLHILLFPILEIMLGSQDS